MFETGLAVGRSLGRAEIRVLGLDSAKKCGFYSKYIDALICPHPLEREEEFIAFLLQIAASEKNRPVLFITSDDFLLPVSRNRKELERHYLMNLPDHSILECITDKFRQHTLALEAGIPVPQTFVAANRDQLVEIKDRVPFPAFVKGAEVTSWRKTMGDSFKGFVVHDREDLMKTFQTIFERGSVGLVQEIIPGPDTNHFKASCYISRDGKWKLIELNPRYWQQNALAEKCGMNFPLTDYLELTDRDPKAVHKYRSGIKWVNIYSDIDSFREYRQRGELSVMQWLRSLKGEKIYSDLNWDDVLPGLREILVVNVRRRSRRYLEKTLKLQSSR